MTSTINARDFQGSLVGAMIAVNPIRGADFKQVYKEDPCFATYQVISDNEGITKDGSGSSDRFDVSQNYPAFAPLDCAV